MDNDKKFWQHEKSLREKNRKKNTRGHAPVLSKNCVSYPLRPQPEPAEGISNRRTAENKSRHLLNIVALQT